MLRVGAGGDLISDSGTFLPEEREFLLFRQILLLTFRDLIRDSGTFLPEERELLLTRQMLLLTF